MLRQGAAFANESGWTAAEQCVLPKEWNRDYMARLSADRLLYTFRANAGLPVGSAKPLGGWEQPESGQRSSELREHFGGHFLTASAPLAAMGDKEAKAKGD